MKRSITSQSLGSALLFGFSFLLFAPGCGTVRIHDNRDLISPKTPAKQHLNELFEMLEDRPAMTTYFSTNGDSRKITESDLPWQFAADVYARQDLPSAIEWGREDPAHPTALGEHSPPQPGRPARIWLRRVYAEGPRKGEEVSFEDLWASFVFEAFNVDNVQGFVSLYWQARNGEMRRREWILAAARLEFQAMLDRKRFYFECWKPWADRSGAITDEASWATAMPDDFDTFMRFYPEESGEWPWDVWGDNFDRIRSTYGERSSQ